MDLMLRIATVEIRNQDMSKSSPGNQAAIHWLEKEAADAGLATETKIEPRRYSGGNADLDETASLDFRKAHRIPPGRMARNLDLLGDRRWWNGRSGFIS